MFLDYCKRMVRHDDGEAEIFCIPRHKCNNSRCRKIHRMLPSFMVPFKHYTEDVIGDAVNDSHPQALESDGPSLITIKRWKRWIRLNKTDVDGLLKSIGYRELGFSKELLRSGVSLLEELMRSIPYGWLQTILCLIYNTGGRMTPVYESFSSTLIFMSADGVVCSP